MVTTYGKNLIMNHVFHTSNETTLPSKYYLGLSTTEPTLAGGNFTEPSSATAYGRIEITGLANAVSGVVTNSTLLPFAESTGDQGTIPYYGVFDASSGGNLIMYGELTNTRIVQTETLLAFKIGALSLKLTDA